MNIAHEDGSMTLDNRSVQRLMDYNILHYTDEGWYVGRWPETNSPSAAGIEARSGETAQIGSTRMAKARSEGAAQNAAD